MSELLQSGQHPDADQLSAFVEHALSPHEQQQTLEHLAICPDCRTIVALSLPPVDELPEPPAKPARRPWFFGWNFVVPTAAAFAGLAVVVYLHSSASSKRSALPSQEAVSRPPTSLPIPATPSIPAPEKPLPPASKTPQTNLRPAATGLPSSLSNKATVDTQSLAKLPTEGRNIANQAQRQQVSTFGAVHGSLGAASGGSVYSAGAATALSTAPAGTTLDRLQNGSEVAQTHLSNQSAPPPAPPPATTFLEQSAAAPAPATVPGEMGAARAANQTVDVVVNANPIATLSSTSDSLVVSEATSVPVQHPLPSHLPTLSVVSTAHQILAIDTTNTLYFSDDDGQHWKAIPTQWQGRAVKVDLVSPAIQRRSVIGGIGNARPGTVVSLSSSMLGTTSTLAGTITDPTGAVIADASVAVSDAKRSIVRTVKTDRSGYYVVNGLVPGSYQIEAHAPGFSTQQLAVTLAASQQSVANIALPVGQASEAVTVEASAMSSLVQPLAKTKAVEPQPVQPLFAITTDTGERWTSIDGQIWKHN